MLNLISVFIAFFYFANFSQLLLLVTAQHPLVLLDAVLVVTKLGSFSISGRTVVNIWFDSAIYFINILVVLFLNTEKLVADDAFILT